MSWQVITILILLKLTYTSPAWPCSLNIMQYYQLESAEASVQDHTRPKHHLP